MNESGLCECGCGQKTKIAPRTSAVHGYVKGKPRRYVKGHNARSVGPHFIEQGEMDCWIWQLGRSASGYGQWAGNGHTQRAHRVYYEDLIGPIPDGKELHHVCLNRACVNPGHLEALTEKEHRERHRSSTHCIHGHPFDEENTYWMKDRKGERRWKFCRTCGRARTQAWAARQKKAA